MAKLTVDTGKKNAGVMYYYPGNMLESRNFGVDEGMEESRKIMGRVRDSGNT